MNARPQHPFTSALALVTAAIGWDPSGVFLQPYGPLLPTGGAPGEHDYGPPLGAMTRDSDPDLLHNGDQAYGKGQAGWVQGTVTDTRGQPLAGALVATLSDPARSRVLAREARALLAQRYDWGSIARDTVDCYRRSEPAG